MVEFDLQEDLDSIVSTLEKLEEETESLRDECRMLTEQVETEEERAREVSNICSAIYTSYTAVNIKILFFF